MVVEREELGLEVRLRSALVDEVMEEEQQLSPLRGLSPTNTRSIHTSLVYEFHFVGGVR